LRAASLFGALVFLAFLFPVSHVVPFQALMAERFLFAPSLGAILFAVASVARLRPSIRTHAVLRRAPAAMVAVFAMLTVMRVADWRSEVTLWESLASRVDDDPRVYANLGRGYLKAGDSARAVEALQESLRIAPDHISSLNNVAVLQLEAGDYVSARKTYRRVIELEPDSHVAWTNLGVIESRLLRHADAKIFYERALEIDLNHGPARDNLAVAKQMVAKANGMLREYSDVDPNALPLAKLRDYVLAHWVVGDFEESTHLYAALQSRAPGSPEVRIPELEFQLAALAQAE
jgi:Tfp pilus assembly protein PilF